MFLAMDHAQEPGGCATMTWIGFCLCPGPSGSSGAPAPKIEPRFAKDLGDDECADANTESAISCDGDSSGLAGAVSAGVGVWVVDSEAALLLGASEEEGLLPDGGGAEGASDDGDGASLVSGWIPITCSRLATAEGIEFVWPVLIRADT